MIEFRKLPFEESQVFVTSDTHYSHKNICKGTSTWESGYRDFNTLEEMNQTIVNNINKMVKEDDCLIHLGDWSFGGVDKIWEFRKQINCKNIYLAWGNHCSHIRSNKEINISLEDVEIIEKLNLKAYNRLVNGEVFVKAKELFTETFDLEYLKVEHQSMVVCHYPLFSWFHINKGVWNLGGHEHSMLNAYNENCKRLDVGIDSAFQYFGEYRPFTFQEIKEIMSKKPVQKLGHHI